MVDMYSSVNTICRLKRQLWADVCSKAEGYTCDWINYRQLFICIYPFGDGDTLGLRVNKNQFL